MWTLNDLSDYNTQDVTTAAQNGVNVEEFDAGCRPRLGTKSQTVMITRGHSIVDNACASKMHLSSWGMSAPMNSHQGCYFH